MANAGFENAIKNYLDKRAGSKRLCNAAIPCRPSKT